jgi:sugar phosphate isomerase/epimerase
MWTLTGFGDEISPDLDEQLATLSESNLRYIDFRGVWNTNVLHLSDDKLARFKAGLDDAGVKVSSVASPIGKVPISSDFAPQLDAFQRALQIARMFETPYVRIFSYFLPEGDDPARYRDEVMSRMTRLVEAAAETPVTLIHENERNIYGETPERCFDIFSTINSPKLRAVWDPANFLHSDVQSFPEGYEQMRPYMAYVHVKDYIVGQKQMTPAGEGEAHWPEMLAALRDSGFDGFFSLEPHLQHGGAFGGFSGPERFRVAVDALKSLFRAQGKAWQ